MTGHAERECAKCGERFFRGKSARLVCGVCWPCDLSSPIKWAAVAVARRAISPGAEDALTAERRRP